jgi:hypothetical protein
VAALGTAQTVAWASSYYLPAILAVRSDGVKVPFLPFRNLDGHSSCRDLASIVSKIKSGSRMERTATLPADI